MATLREYCKNLSDSQLRALLKEECEGRGSLPIEAILEICDVLAQRNPALPSTRQTLLKLCLTYLEL